ncbi:MAG: hypothetical protein V4724_15665 [Pseudomonadota bacterium]
MTPAREMEQAVPLRLLLVEDSDFDADLIDELLHNAGLSFQMQRVKTASSFCSAIDASVDLIISDYVMQAS